MVSRTTIEAMLKPHLRELEHLLTFITSEEGAILTRGAAGAAYDYHTDLGDRPLAKRIQEAVSVVLASRHSLLRNDGVDFARLTPEMINGLWEICALTSNPGVFDELPRFRTRLQAPEHDFFTLLAGALNRLRES